MKPFRSKFRVPSSRFDANAGNRTLKPSRKAASRRQRGAVLFIALIVLVAMTLAGIAIMRSVDTATLIAGNIAFKQGTAQSADNGVEFAYQWLIANRTTLATSNVGQGYYSGLANPVWTSPATWTTAVTVGTEAATGNTISYLIHRMCNLPDAIYSATNQQCALDNPAAGTAPPPPAQGDSYTVGAPGYAQDPRVYYRITVRSSGPRNTVSYIQSMVAIAL